MKEPTFAPAYVGLFPILSEVAQKHGYALAVHGSVSRDFDLVAVPWIKDASEAAALMIAIANQIHISMGGRQGNMVPLSTPEQKPHGRLSWAMPISCGAMIDLSVMPCNRELDRYRAMERRVLADLDLLEAESSTRKG